MPKRHPCSVAEFDAIYQQHWRAADQPLRYIAYLRAEADVEREHGARKYKSFESFDRSHRRWAAAQRRKRCKNKHTTSTN